MGEPVTDNSTEKPEMSLLREGATPIERARYWWMIFVAWLRPALEQLHRGPRLWIRDWLHITSDSQQIVAYSNRLRHDHDALAHTVRELARQHREFGALTHENHRRLRWHEVGPLRVSKVALDKKDQERARREKVKLASGNGDGAEAAASMPVVREAERCPAIKKTDFGTFRCHLRVGHESEPGVPSDHESRLENGQRAQWPNGVRTATEGEASA